ncbi:UNVERIFIED_CONTAM: Myosin-8 [Sesamum radiatum]|uniref:Myosin-8 n=1 Tax=Sesamum radiatum TaxID=300843 RepID=A0AAW2W3Z5_SESRA
MLHTSPLIMTICDIYLSRELLRWFHDSMHEVTACNMILEKVGLKGYEIGKTKVFLRAGQMAELDARRAEVLGRAASTIQRKFLSYMARKSFILWRCSAIFIQSVCRGELTRPIYEGMRREASCIATETVALQAAKNKLEKQVEQLTWKLELEKRMRADLEEAKTQENTKLQTALHDLERQLKETKDILLKEREAAKLAAEKVPVIQETPVMDHEMMDKLAAENEKLKAKVSSLETKIDETKKKHEERNKLSEERLKQAMEAQSIIVKLKTIMHRLKPAGAAGENPVRNREDDIGIQILSWFSFQDGFRSSPSSVSLAAAAAALETVAQLKPNTQQLCFSTSIFPYPLRKSTALLKIT